MALFGFGKKAKKAVNEMKKMERRDYLEAIVGSSLLVAAADGEIEKEESVKIDQLLRTNKNLAHFGSEITDLVNRFTELLQADFRSGKLQIMREIGDIQGDQQEKEDLIVMMLAIAESDGEVEEKERQVMDAVCQKLGMRLSDFE